MLTANDALQAEGFMDCMTSSGEAAELGLVEFAIAGGSGKRWVISPNALHHMFQAPGLYWRPASGAGQAAAPADERWILPS